MTADNSPEMHLLTLATRGKHPGASGGEARACRIVRCLLDDIPGLDPKAELGISALLQALIAGDWDLIETFRDAMSE